MDTAGFVTFDWYEIVDSLDFIYSLTTLSNFIIGRSTNFI